MPWADDAGVLAVYCRNRREVQALSDRDHGRIDDAEGKAQILLDEFRDARDVTFLDFSNVGSHCRRMTSEGDLRVRRNEMRSPPIRQE